MRAAPDQRPAPSRTDSESRPATQQRAPEPTRKRGRVIQASSLLLVLPCDEGPRTRGKSQFKRIRPPPRSPPAAASSSASAPCRCRVSAMNVAGSRKEADEGPAPLPATQRALKPLTRPGKREKSPVVSAPRTKMISAHPSRRPRGTPGIRLGGPRPGEEEQAGRSCSVRPSSLVGVRGSGRTARALDLNRGGRAPIHPIERDAELRAAHGAAAREEVESPPERRATSTGVEKLRRRPGPPASQRRRRGL